MRKTSDLANSEARGHRALVLGASGGIGAALSKALAAQGKDVVNLSRTADDFDITDSDKVKLQMESLCGTFDSVLIASGILAAEGQRPEKSLNEIDSEKMARVFAVNAIGPALVLRHLPRILPLHSRAVVGVLTARVGSIGDNRLGGWYSYRAAKAAANQIVHTAAVELSRLRKHAIVVALHPGTVDTPFTSEYSRHPKIGRDEAAANLLSVLEGLSPFDTGGFFDRAGNTIPW